MKTTKLPVARAALLEMARLHHVLFTLSSLYYDCGGGGTWRGTTREGWYASDDLEGNRLVLAWNRLGLVGLVFDHESERSEYDLDEDARRPLRWLKRLPARLRPLATRTAAAFENLVTAGFWSDGDGVTLSDPLAPRGCAHGLELIAGLLLAAEDAVFGDALAQSWLELSSLDEGHARLAMRLAAEAARGPTRVHSADQSQILTLPGDRKTIGLAAARRVQQDLAAVGISWSIPRRRILALDAEKRRADEARVAAALAPDERSLFEAARANDPESVAALVARGAAVDARTVEGQWQHTPAGDTPLIQACKAGAREAALALLRAGADPRATNRFGQTPLLWSARAKLRDVVAACLAAGGDPNLADERGEAPLLHAAQCGDAAMVELLLAAGARAGATTRSGVTAADRASMHGHPDIARHLRRRA